MNAETKIWIDVGKITDIPLLGARCVKLGLLSVAVFRAEADRIFALEDKCPHKKGPLSQGIIHGDCVTCPLHNWIIDLKTGAAIGTDNGKTMSIPVKVEAGRILISFPH
jgi:nitrite reductase (NADH) small subunit